MKKYFILAAIFGFLSFAISMDRRANQASPGFGVSAGLCIVAAAIVERRKSSVE